MTTANLIKIFCILDELCKYSTPELKKHLVEFFQVLTRLRPASMRRKMKRRMVKPQSEDPP